MNRVLDLLTNVFNTDPPQAPPIRMKILWHEMHIKAKREPYAAFVLSTHMYD
jgi:hypothetical protein